MIKSKYVFYILGFAYLGIAIGSLFSVFLISENVLLGLSISSCLVSIGELISNLRSYIMCKNSYLYSLSFASSYLNNCIAENRQPRTNVDVYNIKNNIDNALSNRKSKHPVEYDRKKVFSFLFSFSQGFFVLGIVIFIIVPFATISKNAQVSSRIITILAFAFVCLNIAVNDQIQEYVSAKAAFECDKLIVIDDAFNGFVYEYNNHLLHYTQYTDQQKKTLTSSEGNDSSSASLFDRLGRS